MGWLVSYESVVKERIHQGIADQIIPSVLKYFDLPDVMAAIAPRKVAVFSGVNPLGQELAIARLRQGTRIPPSKWVCATVKNRISSRFSSGSSCRHRSEHTFVWLGDFLFGVAWRIMRAGDPMSSHIVTSNTEAAILARVIESDACAVTPDVARYLLSMQLPRADEERVNELSAKARAGSLSEGEAQELDSYLHIGRLLAVMQSRARRHLKNSDHDAGKS